MKALAVLILLLSSQLVYAQSMKSWLDPDYETAEQAEAAFKKKQLQAAFKKYKELYRSLQQQGLGDSERAAKLDYNLGNLFLQAGKYKQANEFFMQAAEKTNRSELKSRALNNLGNSLSKQGESRDALRAFQESIQADPKNKTAADNLERVVRQMVQQQQQQQQQQESGEKQDGEESENESQAEAAESESQETKDGEKGDEQEIKPEDKLEDDGTFGDEEETGEEKDGKGESESDEPGDEERRQAERMLDQYSEDKVKRRHQGSRKRAKKPW